MGHEIVFDTVRNINPIAFVGEVPWHGLGQQLTPDTPLEVWAQQAGMDWEIKSGPALYLDDEGLLRGFPGRKMLRRSDSQYPLSIVSEGYNVVQPMETLNFMDSLIKTAGFKMNTAGVLFNGKKFWALAELGESARILGQDRIDGYLLLATSCDTSLATTAMFTSIRVVCNNTLGFAVRDGEAGKSRRYLKVPHSMEFDADAVKAELGLAGDSWSTYVNSVNELAKCTVSDREALEWLIRVFSKVEDGVEITDEIVSEVEDAKNIQHCFTLFKGAGKGAELKSASGTAWGLVNAVTEWADHGRKTKSIDTKLNNAWFGTTANIKQRAWDEALKLAS